MNAFNAQVQWARAQCSAVAKPRGWAEKGRTIVTLEEVLEEAHKLYPNRKLSQAAARTWVARGLIPAPNIESLGRGKGTRANYPKETPLQMAAAAWMQDKAQAKQTEISEARRFVVLNDAWFEDKEAQELINGFLSISLNGSRYRSIDDMVSVEDLRKTLDVLWYSRCLELLKQGLSLDTTGLSVYKVYFSETDIPAVQLRLKQFTPQEKNQLVVEVELIEPEEEALYMNDPDEYIHDVD